MLPRVLEIYMYRESSLLMKRGQKFLTPEAMSASISIGVYTILFSRM
jgi:hypothetical protein